MQKVVGITSSTSAKTEDWGPRHYLNRAYAWAVERAGAIPVLLPATSDPDAWCALLGRMDGILLSGGVDVAPELFGQDRHPNLGSVDDDRDCLELPLIRGAVEQDMPIFGICRGIQALNIALGGGLIQDIPTQAPSAIQHDQTALNIPRSQTSHTVSIEPGSRLRSIAGAGEMATNSFHHQALQNLAPGLVVTARAADGIIEAVEAPGSRYLLAVQFHPEETAPTDENSRRLFEAFVRAL